MSPLAGSRGSVPTWAHVSKPIQSAAELLPLIIRGDPTTPFEGYSVDCLCSSVFASTVIVAARRMRAISRDRL